MVEVRKLTFSIPRTISRASFTRISRSPRTPAAFLDPPRVITRIRKSRLNRDRRGDLTSKRLSRAFVGSENSRGEQPFRGSRTHVTTIDTLFSLISPLLAPLLSSFLFLSFFATKTCISGTASRPAAQGRAPKTNSNQNPVPPRVPINLIAITTVWSLERSTEENGSPDRWRNNATIREILYRMEKKRSSGFQWKIVAIRAKVDFQYKFSLC